MLVLKDLFFFVFIAVCFMIGGRVDYWQGWVFSIITFLIIVIASVKFADKTDLIKERDMPSPEVKWWDRIFTLLLIPLFLILYIVAFLDAGRFRWSMELPVSVYVISYIVYVFSYFIIFWAMWTNRFFSTVVRIQKDRGQLVVQDGPYRLVRHPGYAGFILLFITNSLVLGSLLALIPAGFMIILLIIRTYLEDITLQKELSGYTDYAKKVRYRLLPGIW